MKRMDFESGAHVGVEARTRMVRVVSGRSGSLITSDSGSEVSRRAGPPPRGRTHTCCEPLRSEVNASHFPSGDGAGSLSRVESEGARVNVVAPAPAGGQAG